MSFVERWVPEVHLPQVMYWAEQRGHAFPRAAGLSVYPETSWVVDSCVAGSLFLTNARGVAYIDNFMSDPNVERSARRFAMKALIETILNEAEARDIKVLCGATSHPNIIKACLELGFAGLGTGYTMLTAKLGGS